MMPTLHSELYAEKAAPFTLLLIRFCFLNKEVHLLILNVSNVLNYTVLNYSVLNMVLIFFILYIYNSKRVLFLFFF